MLPDGGASRCDAGAFVFCDGFEQGLGAWTDYTGGGGTVSVDSTHVVRGQLALHAALPTVGSAVTAMRALVEHDQMWPPLISVRFFIYLSLPGATHASVSNILNLNDTTPLNGTNIYLTGNAPGVIALGTFGTAGSQAAPLGALPLDEWTCIELEVDGANEQIWINDTSIVTIGLPADVANLRATLGLDHMDTRAGDGAFDAWFDEVAVAGEHIGCQR
jgi:hypothetical protein